MKLAPAIFLALAAFAPALPACAPGGAASSLPRGPAASTQPAGKGALADGRPAFPAVKSPLAELTEVTEAPSHSGHQDAAFLLAGSALADPYPEASSSAEPAVPSACNEQPPQQFLIRSQFIFKQDAPLEEGLRRNKLHAAAIEYRTTRYGYVDGFGQRMWNRYDPVYYSDVTKFFGIKVRMNKRVIPALHCVEEEIQRTCSAHPYVPRILEGIRFRNTFHNGEVTNHAYGIAIDIDPDRNSCCGCVPPHNSSSRCSRPAATPYDRTSIPKCWVDAFVKYGFYWLGDDPMEDTMHFEFLGDPDKILRETAQR